MTVRIALKTDPVTRPLRAPYAGATVTVRRLRTPQWEAARDAAQALLRDDARLLEKLIDHDLLPEGGVKGWKRMKDQDPVAYAQFLVGIALWLTAVECALVGVLEWTGVEVEKGVPAPLTREVLEAALLDDGLSGQVMGLLTEAARLLIVEGEPFGASPNGSSEPGKTASAPNTAQAAIN